MYFLLKLFKFCDLLKPHPVLTIWCMMYLTKIIIFGTYINLFRFLYPISLPFQNGVVPAVCHPDAARVQGRAPYFADSHNPVTAASIDGPQHVCHRVDAVERWVNGRDNLISIWGIFIDGQVSSMPASYVVTIRIAVNTDKRIINSKEGANIGNNEDLQMI